jgi:hypothetical protein
MFMNVGYTPPPPTWPPKTTNGMGVYLPQNFVTPQRLLAALQSAQIQIPQGWGASDCGMGCCSSCASGGACSGHSHGMGLFDSGTDISGWGLPEWGIVGVAALAGVSLLKGAFTKKTTASYRRTKRTGKRDAYGTIGFQRGI